VSSEADAVGADPHTTAGKLAELRRRYDEAVHAGSARAVERQHAKGKKTARERIELLLDEDSFVELDEFARHRSTTFGMDANRPFGDGVITGYGTVDGRPVCVFSQDVTVFGGSLGEVYGEKIVKVLDFAMRNGCPVVGINEGGGARIQEGVVSLGLYGEIFYRNVQASGVIPQISLVLGAAAGGHVYSPALTDFVVMVDKTSQMFITGPDVVRTVTGEDVTLEELGGARIHNTTSGNAHYLASDEDDAINYVKALLSYLPSNNLDAPPIYDTVVETGVQADDEFLDTFMPDSANAPYDMHDIIEHLLDNNEFLEVQELFAPNILVGFGRIEGYPVGIVGNQPLVYAGCLNIDASEKAARFVRTCDAFNIPIITLVDVPGFLPGVDQEHAGIIRRGAKLIYAYAEATVPKITIVTRKAFGGAYDVMGSKHLGADVNVAWPTAQIAVILYRRELAASDNPEELRAKVVTDYEDTLVNPYIAAERGYIDSVIPPSQTRSYVVKSLRMLRNKRQSSPAKKHGNIPL
jgi:propionyl-CoA carboxylase beta chain